MMDRVGRPSGGGQEDDSDHANRRTETARDRCSASGGHLEKCNASCTGPPTLCCGYFDARDLAWVEEHREPLLAQGRY
jgi:hypothetical protein